MWQHTDSITIHTSAARVWALFSDVPSWPRWNAGIERIELKGPFATGSTFFMQPPGTDGFESRLTWVEANQGFSDETVFEGHTITVRHDIKTVSETQVQVSYHCQVAGPQAAEVGPMVSGDFPQVLGKLKQLAETASS